MYIHDGFCTYGCPYTILSEIKSSNYNKFKIYSYFLRFPQQASVFTVVGIGLVAPGARIVTGDFVWPTPNKIATVYLVYFLLDRSNVHKVLSQSVRGNV